MLLSSSCPYLSPGIRHHTPRVAALVLSLSQPGYQTSYIACCSPRPVLISALVSESYTSCCCPRPVLVPASASDIIHHLLLPSSCPYLKHILLSSSSCPCLNLWHLPPLPPLLYYSCIVYIPCCCPRPVSISAFGTLWHLTLLPSSCPYLGHPLASHVVAFVLSLSRPPFGISRLLPSSCPYLRLQH